MIKSHRVMYIDGHELRRLFMGGVDWLSRHVDTINNLNVFPVPDGDTGTNMLLTVKKAQSFIENLGDDHIGRLSESLATGARYGARGNSGTILSMLLRGFSQGLASCEVMDAQALAIACQHAVEYAYDTVRSVMTPQEGTILTVARATAEAVVSAVESESNLVRLLDRMVQAATVSLQETPELLPVLKDAGVVDSGGAGLLALLEGFQRVVLEDNTLPSAFDALSQTTQTGATIEVAKQPSADVLQPEDPEGYGYDVQFLMLGDDLDIRQVQHDISAMGWSPLVDGDSRMIKVHIHVHNPALPLDYAIRSGAELDDIVVENMQRQFESFVSVPQPNPNGHVSSNLVDDIAVVAVVRGEGLRNLFTEYGVTAIVEGGQTMNPSTGDFLDVINALPNRRVIILPNNKNVVLTARDAAEMSDRVVEVVPTRSIPQGLAALLAFGDVQESSLDEIVDAMQSAAAFVITMEVTKSTRSVEKLGDISVEDGDYIVLANDKAVASSPEMTDAILSGFAALELDGRELVTVYYGEEISQQAAESLIERLQVISPKLQFEAVSGGQPLYPFLLSIE